MSNVELFWMCRACKENRPEAWISVAKRRIVVDRGEPIDLTACYCNDRPRCFQEMPRILDEMARTIIDGLIAPRVHVLWQGFAICDSHKRFPADFPKGSKWIDVKGAVLRSELQATLGSVEVTCKPCSDRLMLFYIVGREALTLPDPPGQ
jgi:hypothetical protein